MSFRASLAFFTRFPVGNIPQHMSLHGLTAFLPAVGLCVGLCVGLLLLLFALFFSPTLAGILGALVWVGITGGLHMDGLADCADALVVEASKEKRLAIMKDPTVGTFASIAVFFILSIKVWALAHVAQHFFNPQNMYGILFGLLGLCFSASLARAMVLVARRAPHAREHLQDQGLGKTVTKHITSKAEKNNALLMGVLALCTGYVASYLPAQSMIMYSVPLACMGALACTYALVNKAKKSLGGVTGDVYGCLIELTECIVLLALCLT